MNKYGLLGRILSHSFSKIIHEYFFDVNGICASYDLIEIEENQIEETLELLRKNVYQGFNVTIPYKETVIKYLDELSLAASNINAVNTIYVKDGKLIGDNTDYLGFIEQLNYLQIEVQNKDIYVLGSGGASKALCYALRKLNANPVIVSRNKEDGITYSELENIDSFYMIINTTPVGMYPNIDGEILPKRIVEKAKYAIDIICNPKVTKFLDYSKCGHNGILMLIYQALHAEKLWGNDLKFSINDLLEKL